MKKKKLPNLDSWITYKLRRLSFHWPGRSEAIRLARIAPGIYKCAQCGKECKQKLKEFHLDHKSPVVPLDGKNKRKDNPLRLDFNSYIDRLFVPAEGFQVLCIVCHDSKTRVEDDYRGKCKKFNRLKK